MNHRSKSLCQSASDEACIACGNQDGSVVWAHSNELMHGKGKSIKAHDLLGLYLCARCHTEYDQGKMTRDERRHFFREHYPLTMVRVAEKLARGELKL